MSGAARPLQLGKYRLIAKLGQGGAASVYLAMASGPAGVNKLLVVKVLSGELATDPDNVRMFLDEARLCTRLSHPNIVQMMEVGKDGNFYFAVMEYLEGNPLSRLMHGIPGIGTNVLLHLLAEALSGLHDAHELADYDGAPLGVVHRDISPNNLFVTYEGHAKVLDFGVAKTLDSAQTEFGVVKGKPRYMAPEQALGQNPDRRADIFSVGVILWEIAAGRRMWAGKHDMAVLFAVTSGQIPSLAEVAPDAPPELARIVARALEPARNDRYPTALALQEDIEAYLRSTGEVITSRSIGRSLATHFAAARAEMKATVDQQLRAAASLSGNFTVVTLQRYEPGLFGNEGSNSQTEAGVPGRPGPFALTNSTPPPKTGHRWFLSVGAVVVAIIAFLGWTSLPAKGHGDTSSAQPNPSASPVNPVNPVPSASAAAVDTSASAAAAPSADTGATGASASSAAANGSTVDVTLKAFPVEAKLFVDGKPLATNPFSGHLPKDDAAHVLHAAAPGYVPRDEPLTLAKDAFIELTLVKHVHAGGAWGAKPSAPPEAPPPAVTVAPVVPPPATSAPPSKKRAVDRTDPYAQ